MIPKIIHYCWYGRGKLSPEIELCLASWRKYCPDYEIKLWNEDNTPMHIAWIKEAYRYQKYAFMADYMRFYALYHYGGVYMDTDMLLIKPLDGFLMNKSFLGREDEHNASMGIIGTEKGDKLCAMCMDFYDKTKFDMVHPPIITRFITPHLFQYGFVESDVTQCLSNGLMVYQSSYFYPIHYSQQFDLGDIVPMPHSNQKIDYATCLDQCGDYGGYVKENVPTYGIHLWNKSWVDEISLLAQGRYAEGFPLVWKRFKLTPVLPLAYWKKVFKYLIKSLLKTGRKKSS